MLSPLLCLAALKTTSVQTMAELRQALAKAKPGDEILIAPGRYAGGAHFENLRGTREKPIKIRAAHPADPPLFTAGLQFSDVAYLELRDLTIRGAHDNGLNIDDGGTLDTPSHHVTLRNIRVADLPKGNHDGIKLSGLEDFWIENCTVERWGGSAIDMVGCHRGRIENCRFRQGDDSGVQTKGGTSEVQILRCRFEDFGQRGVNIGGSTGTPFFRPPIDRMPARARYEAKNIEVQGCTFRGGVAPIAFVGVDGATVRFNTIVDPGRWAIRILQETTAPGFLPSQNGLFADNLILFRSPTWASGGVNIGGGTLPQTFRFQRNFWFCQDQPAQSRPTLPTPETGGTYGQNPHLNPDLTVPKNSPARGHGAQAFSPLGLR